MNQTKEVKEATSEYPTHLQSSMKYEEKYKQKGGGNVSLISDLLMLQVRVCVAVQ